VTRQRLFSVLWIIELIVGLFPIAMVLLASIPSYILLLTILPKLLLNWDAAALRSFLTIIAMILCGTLGLTGITIASAERLRRDPRLKRLAVLFGCAGVAAETIYVLNEGFRATASNPFTLWALLGPLIIGLHCLYRSFQVENAG